MKVKSYDYWLMFACLLWLLLLSLSPVVSRDALIHHMALPKLWLKWGLFSIDKYRDYAFYPSNLQVLYHAALFYNLEFLPKIIHSLFLFLTGCIVYRYLRFSGINRHLSLLAFVLILTIPICQRLASQVYVDLGLLFFSTLSLLSFMYWKNSDFCTKKYFYISAIAAGLALGTKYNGLLVLANMCFFCLLAYGSYTKKYANALLYSCKFVAVAIVLASPWLIRNYLVSGGNPFFPLLTSIFPDTIDEAKPLYPVLNHRLLLRMLEGESLVEVLLLPVRIFFEGEDNNFLRFDGKLNPMMLVLLPFAFMYQRGSRNGASAGSANTIKPTTIVMSDKLIFLFFVVSIIMISLNSRDIRVRYLIPIISPIVILTILSVDNLLSQKRKVLRYFSYLSIGIYIMYNIVYGYELFHDIDHIKYLIGQESKIDYIRRKIVFYPIYEYINQHTKHNAIIYDVMSGHRSYYVDREYIHHPRHVDTVFMNYISQKKTYRDYETYLHKLKTRNGTGVTHLLIRPYLFINTYKGIFPEYERGAVQNFVQFLNRQKLLLQVGDTRLYELVAR
jgi:hypothetical protein